MMASIFCCQQQKMLLLRSIKASLSQPLLKHLNSSQRLIKLGLELGGRLLGREGGRGRRRRALALLGRAVLGGVQAHGDRRKGAAGQPLVGGVRGAAGEGGREQVLLEGVALAGHDEGQRLHAARGQLQQPGRLAPHHVQAALGHGAHALGGRGRAELVDGDAEGRLVHDLEVPDVPVALPGQVQQAGVRVVEGQQHPGGHVDVHRLQRRRQVGGVPDLDLPAGLPREAHAGQLALVAHEGQLDRLRARVRLRDLVGHAAGPRVQHAHGLVLAGGVQVRALVVPGQVVQEVGVRGVAAHELRLLLDVPELDAIISRA
mmetsp:Transcript_3005/g.5126  ORF Transcript_3005/g.5126 Transcript_3005/m.5126 type:complete len:317 (-) Transcript_3005:281-1231(-)